MDDVEREPGALPMLSTALLELWQRRDGRRLRMVEYERSGGVRGAVARQAEAAFGRLDERQQAVARGVLLRLTTEGARRERSSAGASRWPSSTRSATPMSRRSSACSPMSAS